MTETKHLKSKICLVGEKAVGKTSLVRRYVLNMFDDQYITTIGTRVSKKETRVFLPERDVLVDVDMQIWDIMGEKGFRELLKDAYFYGANGILAVADLSRRKTLDDLDDWIDGVEQVVGKVPILIAVNKSDLVSSAQFGDRDVEQVARAFDCPYLLTSAKSGSNVEEAFRRIGQMVTESQLAPI
jgi:small GTP-binding protein